MSLKRNIFTLLTSSPNGGVMRLTLLVITHSGQTHYWQQMNRIRPRLLLALHHHIHLQLTKHSLPYHSASGPNQLLAPVAIEGSTQQTSLLCVYVCVRARVCALTSCPLFQSTPLHLAAGYNRVRIVQLLLQHGADVHAKDKGWDITGIRGVLISHLVIFYDTNLTLVPTAASFPFIMLAPMGTLRSQNFSSK